jgi:FKBP-type peptidyl-prolyl cis-trans isomerase
MKKIAILIMLVLTLTSCIDTKNNEKDIEVKAEVSENNIVKKTDTISVTYTGSLEDGTVFDASSKHPWQILSFEVWAWKMIPWFDFGVVGMKLGETKTINVIASEAYGESNELELKDEDFIALEGVGVKKENLTVWIHKIESTGWEIEILRIDWDKIYAKHPSPLAGKNLIFEVTIDKIVPYIKKEIVNTWDNISVTYTGSLKDGTVFDATSKHGWVPLEFTAWAGQMIAGFDAGVIGMKLGETKTINIIASEAYGETWTHELAWKDLVFEVKIESIK